MRVSRWWCLAFSALLETVAGLNLIVGLFSNGLKEKLGLTQSEILTIATMINLGGSFGLPQGIINDNFGPRAAIIAGCIATFTGYFIIWATAAGVIGQSLVLLCIAGFVAGSENCFWDNTCIIVNAKNFPEQTGVVIGLLSSIMAVSASISTQLYVTFFQADDNWIGFLLFVAVGLNGVALVAVIFIRDVGYVPGGNYQDGFDGNTKSRFSLMVATVVLLAVYLQMASFVQRNVNGSMLRYMFTGGTYAIVAVFFVVPFLWRKNHEQHVQMKDEDVVDNNDNNDNIVDNNDNNVDEEEDEQNINGIKMIEISTEPSEPTNVSTTADKNLRQTVKDIKFWLLFFSLPAGTASGSMVFNNIAQVVESLGGEPGSESVFVSALGFSQCLGRIGIGVVSSLLEQRISRPWMYFGAMVIMTLSQFALSVSSLKTLYFGCIGTGLAYGSLSSGLCALLADFFGFKNLGTILSLVLIPPMGAGIFTSKFLASAVYTSHSAAGSTKCFGQECYQRVFMIDGAISLVGAVLAFVLCLISRSLYNTRANIKISK